MLTGTVALWDMPRPWESRCHQAMRWRTPVHLKKVFTEPEGSARGLQLPYTPGLVGLVSTIGLLRL